MKRALATLLVLVLALVAAGSALGATQVIGSATVQTDRDQNGAGIAEAFRATATGSGVLESLVVYVDTGNAATTLVTGIYADNGGKPGALIAQGSLAAPKAAAWNTVPLPGGSVTAGTNYWIAVLGRGGQLRFRDKFGGGAAETSASSSLTALPTSWSTGTRYTDGPLSAYALGNASTSPVLTVSPSSLSFTATQGGSSPAAQSLSVGNSGAGTLSYTVATDQPWLGATPASGTAPGTVSVTASVAGLTAGTYTGNVTITATGAGGSPKTVPVTFTVAAPPPPPALTVSPSSLTFTGTQGGSNPAAQTVSVGNGGGGTLSFTTATDQSWLSATPASGSAPATVSVTTSLAGLSPGTYTGTVTVTASGVSGSPKQVAVTLTVGSTPPPPPPSGANWLMWGHDQGRTGSAPDENAITPANAAQLGRKWSVSVDGKVTAQPLYVSGARVGTQTRDALVVATSANSVYALDPTTGATLWRRNFGTQVANCAIPGGYGVTGTPLIDATANRVWTVANDGQLHALSLVDGTDAVTPLAVIDRPATNKVWGGINRFGDTLYIATASDGCDSSPWRGRIYRVDVSGAAPVASGFWDVVPGIAYPDGGGGIWGYGGVSLDPANGNVFAATPADSNEQYTRPWANRMVALDGSLNVLGSYSPPEPNTFPCTGAPCDLDFGATPVSFQPSGCPRLTAAGNKNGQLYLFRAADLAASTQPLQVLTLNQANDWLGSGGIGGVPAYWDAGRMLFVSDVGPGANGVAGGIIGLKVNADCTLSVAWSQPLGGATQPDSTPIVAGGVVYVGEGNGGTIHAFDATNGTELWHSTGGVAAATYGASIVANGTLFSGSWGGFSSTDGGVVQAFAVGSVTTPPPTVLIGNQVVEAQRDQNSLGKAEAFQATATASGAISAISLYLDPSSNVSKVTVGLYADAGGHPGTLLAQGAVSGPTAGNWQSVPVAANLTSGTPYWIAVLGTGGGTIYFRDRAAGPCRSETSSQTTLTALPATWTTGTGYTDCPISAYGLK